VTKFVSKAVEIEALQLKPENAEQLAAWCGGQLVAQHDALGGREYVGLNIPTLEGVMRASEGDWIIRGLRGEFYPCKPDVFAAKYEEIP